MRALSYYPTMQTQNERTIFWFSQTLRNLHGLEIKVSIFSPPENAARANNPPFFSQLPITDSRHALNDGGILSFSL
jgi:hypothetical protein